MRKVNLVLALLIALTLLITFTACKRTVRDNGCISRYTGPGFSSPLTATQLDTVKNLFSANSLPTTNFQFISYYSGPFTDSGVTYLNQSINAYGYVNGLPIFGTYFYWSFRNGVLYAPYANNPQYADPGNDTTGHQTLPALRSLFLKTLEAALYGNKYNYTDGRMGRPGIYYRDSCLTAQLGYIDAAFQLPSNSTVPYGKTLLKVWLVSTGQPYSQIPQRYFPTSPIVFVLDATGAAWCPNPTYPGERILIDPLIYQTTN